MTQRIAAVVICCLLLLPVWASAGQQSPEISADDSRITEEVTRYITQKTDHLGLTIHIKRMAIGAHPVLPAGPLDFAVIAPQQWEGWGYANLAVIARQGDRVVLNSQVQVEVEALADMVVAVRQLDYGTVVSAADIAVQKRDVAAAGGKFAGDISLVVGKRLRTSIRANAVIRTDLLEKVPIIKAGQMVTIVAENEVMKITVAGQAKGSGAEGDTIIVENLSSKKDIPAIVVNATTVRVEF